MHARPQLVQIRRHPRLVRCVGVVERYLVLGQQRFGVIHLARGGNRMQIGRGHLLHHIADVTSSVHETHASRQGPHQRNPQPNLDSANRTVRLVHTELPLTEEIKECGFLFNLHAR